MGYKFYAPYIASRIFDLKTFQRRVPSEKFEDGIDFVPTKKEILFGHHFTSIAGAAPIIGPCIAAYWGWLPAFLWIILGTIFIGAVHDFGALVISVKEKGRTIASITGSVINKRVRIMFLIFVMMLTWLVLAVFAMAIAGLFVNVPTAVLPVNIEIIFAFLIGYLFYKKKTSTLLPSIIALVFLYIFVYLGSLFPISFENLNLNISEQTNLWIVLLFIYSTIASLLPVWILLQPRDYINSHQLIVGLTLLFIGIIIARPAIDAPIVRDLDGVGPDIFPLLFVTIACGAISGFHGLIASGTTSKQIRNIKDSKLIGYGAMLGEGTLALFSLVAAVAGISIVGECNLPSVGRITNLSWEVYYDTWAHATTNKATAFVLGGGALIQSIGIPSALSVTIMAVLVISFAATTLDTATRIQRFILIEIGNSTEISILKNRFIATICSVAPALFLSLWSVEDPNTGLRTQAAWFLWPIFGASNQMLAALIFMILTIYFLKKKRPITLLLIPFSITTIMTLTTLIFKTKSFYTTNLLLLGINILLIILIIWMLCEAFIILKNQLFLK